MAAHVSQFILHTISGYFPRIKLYSSSWFKEVFCRYLLLNLTAFSQYKFCYFQTYETQETWTRACQKRISYIVSQWLYFRTTNVSLSATASNSCTIGSSLFRLLQIARVWLQHVSNLYHYLLIINHTNLILVFLYFLYSKVRTSIVILINYTTFFTNYT